MKNIYSFLNVLFFVVFYHTVVHAQCTGTTNDGTVTPSSSNFTSRSNIGPGEYLTVDVEQNKIYSFRTTGGGNWTNPYLSVTNTSNGSLAYNDNNGPYYTDNCSGGENYASVDWLATFSGQVRVHVTRDGCAGWFSGNSSAVLQYREVAQPADAFGNNIWRVYAYNGNNYDLNGGQGRFGYYDVNSLSIDSRDQWGSSSSPSAATGWNGAAEVPIDDHTVVAKRQGFPCGQYTLNIPWHDDGVKLFVNGTQVANGTGCCGPTSGWTGYLGAYSTVEIRNQEGCGGSGFDLDITNNGGAPGNPATFGSNVWNVYAYDGNDYNLGGGTTYYGYYTEGNLSFDSRNRWCSGCSPAEASGYQGCDPGIDLHTVVSKRRGFPCGYYSIDVTNHDDAAKLFINGTQVFDHAACCDAHPSIWTGFLGANDEIEFRHGEGGGGSHQGLQFNLVTPVTPFGVNEWVVYVYDGNDYNLGSGLIYKGYYTEPNLTYNTQNRWSTNPSTASGYVGCDPGEDNHTVVSKRKGFSCAYYTIDVTNHDDDAQMFINGSQVFNHNGCCDAHNGVWSGYLGPNDEIEFRHGEGGGGSHQGLRFNSTALNSGTLTASNSAFCSGGSSTISLAGEVGNFENLEYNWNGNSGWTTNWQNSEPYTWSSTNVGNTLHVRARLGAASGCSDFYSNTVLISVVADPSISITSQGSSICTDPSSGMTLNASASGGTGTCTYQWQRSTTSASSGFSNVGSNSSSYATGAVTQDIWIRCVRSCNGSDCNTATSGITEINPIPVQPGTPGAVTGCGQVTINAQVGTYGTTCNFYSDAGLNTLVGSGTSYTTNTSGTYYVTSYDAATGCESSAVSVPVSSTPSFNYNVSLSSYNGYGVSCYNATDGIATATISSGGTAPFDYYWSTGAQTLNTASTSNQITGLPAGNYSVTITDDGNCNEVANFTITQPSELVLQSATLSNYNSFNVSCFGGNDASININPNGGTAPYSFAWSDGPSSEDRSGLIAGNYTVTVTDANGCSNNNTYNISEPTELEISVNVGYVCNTSGVYTDAVVTVVGSGGVSPYQYQKNSDGYSGTNIFSGLSNGSSHTFYVQDDNGCTKSQSVNITYPAAGSATGVCEFVYVSPSGSGPLGSKECPTDLLTAIRIASDPGYTFYDPTRYRILMYEGAYFFGQTIEIPSNVIIEGAYEVVGTDWRKNTGLTTTWNISPSEENPNTNVVHKIGVRAVGKSGFELKDIDIEVEGVTGQVNGYGKSVYGIYLSGCNNYNIVRVDVETGNATKGSDGSDGSNGSNGGNGANGQDGHPDNNVGVRPNPAGGWSACCTGGFGGDGENDFYYAGSGQSGACGGGSGGGGGGTNCNTFGCSNPGSGGPGGSGSNGSNGGSGSNGSNGFVNGSGFFVPGSLGSTGASGSNGTAGGGGGGGGAEEDFFCNDGHGGQGGGGGGAGCAGTGGTGGKGGGSNYGIFIYNNGVNGSIIDGDFVGTGNNGAGGSGGDGGNGGNGGSGGNGGWGGSCDVGRGGNGGSGGSGGDGGNGGDGRSGERVYVKLASGTGLVSNSSGIPTTGSPVTVNQFQGCTNSEITLTKGSGSWNFIGSSNPAFVNDVTVSSNDYTNSSPTIKIFYNSTGTYDVQIGSTVYNDFIEITDTRSLPVINAHISQICLGDNINFGTTTTGVDKYEWAVERLVASNPQNPAAFTATAQNTSSFQPTQTGTYQVKLKVFTECCGWSIPVYSQFEVIDIPGSAGTFSVSDNSVCENETGIVYTVSPVSGATSYNWSVPSGASITSGSATNSITVSFGTLSGNISVQPENTCGTGGTLSMSVTVNERPQVTINGATSICNGTNTNLTANTSGGFGSLNYSWSSGSSNQTINVTSNGTYTVTVTDDNGCDDVDQVNVNFYTTTNYIWTGLISSDWHDPMNWDCKVPDNASDVFIPSTAPNQPVVYANGVNMSNGTGECNTIEVQSGASITVKSNAVLEVNNP